MVRIALFDDDPMYLAGMTSYLQKWQKETGFAAAVSAFDCGDALPEKAMQPSFDIIFLDILMPLVNGIELAKELRSAGCTAKIVFLTTSPEFALDSYSVKAAGYLVKPVPYERMKEVLNELMVDIGREPQSLSVKIAGGFRKVYLNDIEFLEACNKKVLFRLRSGGTVEALEPLYYWEKALLATGSFFKCHRSYLVNLSSVGFFDSAVIHTVSGSIIPIARGGSKDFEAAYFSALFPE